MESLGYSTKTIKNEIEANNINNSTLIYDLLLVSFVKEKIKSENLMNTKIPVKEKLSKLNQTTNIVKKTSNVVNSLVKEKLIPIEVVSKKLSSKTENLTNLKQISNLKSLSIDFNNLENTNNEKNLSFRNNIFESKPLSKSNVKGNIFGTNNNPFFKESTNKKLKKTKEVKFENKMKRNFSFKKQYTIEDRPSFEYNPNKLDDSEKFVQTHIFVRSLKQRISIKTPISIAAMLKNKLKIKWSIDAIGNNETLMNFGNIDEEENEEPEGSLHHSNKKILRKASSLGRIKVEKKLFDFNQTSNNEEFKNNQEKKQEKVKSNEDYDYKLAFERSNNNQQNKIDLSFTTTSNSDEEQNDVFYDKNNIPIKYKNSNLQHKTSIIKSKKFSRKDKPPNFFCFEKERKNYILE